MVLFGNEWETDQFCGLGTFLTHKYIFFILYLVAYDGEVYTSLLKINGFIFTPHTIEGKTKVIHHNHIINISSHSKR